MVADFMHVVCTSGALHVIGGGGTRFVSLRFFKSDFSTHWQQVLALACRATWVDVHFLLQTSFGIMCPFSQTMLIHSFIGVTLPSVQAGACVVVACGVVDGTVVGWTVVMVTLDT